MGRYVRRGWAWLLLFVLSGAHGEDLQLFLELVVNEAPSGQVVEVIERTGRYFVAREALQGVGVRLDEAPPDDPVALDSIPGLQSQYDQALQRLLLVLPSDWLPRQERGSRSVTALIPAQSSFGALFNYDVYFSAPDDGVRQGSAWLEQRVFDGFGVIGNTGIWREVSGDLGSDSNGYTRFDTQWRYNQQDSMTSFLGGDLITGAQTWNNAVRVGGVQVARNFGLRPDLITYPLPRFNGDAAVPSSVDLFINNAKVSSDELNPGPFTLNSVPFISGAGEATVVTTDVQGRQVSTSVPFYVTDQLLQQGLFDYSLSAGKLRKDYGLENFSYGSAVASGTVRYGISDEITLEGHGEHGPDLKLGGLGGTFALGRWGTLGSSLAQSQLAGERGQQYSVGYSYYSRNFGVALQHIQRTADYADLSVVSGLENGADGSTLPRRSDQATFSFSRERLGTFGIGYFELHDSENERTRLVNLSWSRNLFGNASLYASFNRELGESGYSAQVQLVVPFDLYSSVSASVERNNTGDYTERVNYSRAVPSQGGVGYNLGYASGESEFRQADATWRTQHAQLQGGTYGSTGDNTYWADLSGSVVAMDGSLFASNRIDDAFVVVNTAGYADVPVRFEHQLLGATDSQGHLLVSWVPSYYGGNYEIDPLGLPVNVRIPEVSQQVAVHQGSGMLLNFQVNSVISASVVLVDTLGAVLPRGTPVLQVESGQRGYVGWDGLVYFEGLQQSNGLRATLADGRTCEVRFELDPRAAVIAQVGPLTCH